MGLKTERQEVYWRVDYFAINFDTPHIHIRLLGWESRQDWLDKKQSITGSDFYFTKQADCESMNFDALKTLCYQKVKGQEKWASATDVIEAVEEKDA